MRPGEVKDPGDRRAVTPRFGPRPEGVLVLALEHAVKPHRRRGRAVVDILGSARGRHENGLGADRIERIEDMLADRSVGGAIRAFGHHLGAVLGQEGEMQDKRRLARQRAQLAQRPLFDRPKGRKVDFGAARPET